MLIVIIASPRRNGFCDNLLIFAVLALNTQGALRCYRGKRDYDLSVACLKTLRMHCTRARRKAGAATAATPEETSAAPSAPIIAAPSTPSSAVPISTVAALPEGPGRAGACASSAP